MRAGSDGSGFVCWMFLFYFHKRYFSRVGFVQGCYNIFF